MLGIAMGTRDPRLDAYITRSAPFARPILRHLRAVVHAGCPGVEETIKWGMPFFVYHGILCHMAAFKQHVAFGMWKGRSLIAARHDRSEEAMGNFGRIRRRSDLPPKRLLVGYVRKAAALREAEPAAKAARRKRPRRVVRVPVDLAAALRKHARARRAFDGFGPSHRREYVEWITGAKREETRARRLNQAVEWMAEGKPRNWKYTRP
jgi:hypothetical protein